MKNVVREARLLARKDGRDRVQVSDLESATVIVDENQETKILAMERGPTGHRTRGREAVATPLQTQRTQADSPVHTQPENDTLREKSRAVKLSQETLSRVVQCDRCKFPNESSG